MRITSIQEHRIIVPLMLALTIAGTETFNLTGISSESCITLFLFFLSTCFIFLKSNKPLSSLSICLCIYLIGGLLTKPNIPINKSILKSSWITIVILKAKQTKMGFSYDAGILESKENKLYPTDYKISGWIKSQTAIQEGDVILAHQNCSKIENAGNPGEFDLTSYYKQKNIFHFLYITDDFKILKKQHVSSTFSKIRIDLEGALEKKMKGQELALAKALILGNTQEIDQQTKQDFSATGSIHVLAVSGMHIALFSAMLLYLLQFTSTFIKRNQAIILALFIIWLYAAITGMSPSVVRAVMMFSIYKMGEMMGFHPRSNQIVMFTAWILLLIDYSYLNDLGFQLSFLAVIGIVNFYPKIRMIYSFKNKILKFFWDASAVSLAAQILTLPLILYHFHAFPNYFLLANLGVTVLSTLAMYIGFTTVFLIWIPYLSDLLAWCFSLILKALSWFIHEIANWPGSVEYGFSINIYGALLLAFSIVLLFITKRLWSLLPLTFILIWLSSVRHAHHHDNHLMIFNHKKAILAVKHNGQCHIFYADSIKHKKDAVDMAKNYLKVYPSKNLDFHQIPKAGRIKLDNLPIELRSDKNGIDIDYNGQDIRIEKSKYDYFKLVVVKNKQHQLMVSALKFDY